MTEGAYNLAASDGLLTKIYSQRTLINERKNTTICLKLKR